VHGAGDVEARAVLGDSPAAAGPWRRRLWRCATQRV